MKPESPSPQSMFAPQKVSNDDEDVLQETLHRYSHRFFVLGGIAIFLLALVLYMYYSKVGTPVAHLEHNTETQVTTTQSPGTTASDMEAPPLAVAADGTSSSVQCPDGTSRLIYIDTQPLCCQGDVCSEVQ